MPKTSLYHFRVEDGDTIGHIAIQVSEQCQQCKHFGLYSPSCKAFPDGIPEKILSGEIDHNKPLPDQDNEIVFENKR
ncbi:hypothetical protein ACFL3R_01370 [Thermodesulfobacteriota bacterium]